MHATLRSYFFLGSPNSKQSNSATCNLHYLMPTLLQCHTYSNIFYFTFFHRQSENNDKIKNVVPVRLAIICWRCKKKKWKIKILRQNVSVHCVTGFYTLWEIFITNRESGTHGQYQKSINKMIKKVVSNAISCQIILSYIIYRHRFYFHKIGDIFLIKIET